MERPRSHASEVDRSDPLGHSASSCAVHRQPRSECHEDSERLRGVVRSPKGEQKALQVQLQEREYVVRVQRHLLGPGGGLAACGKVFLLGLPRSCQFGGNAPLMAVIAQILFIWF